MYLGIMLVNRIAPVLCAPVLQRCNALRPGCSKLMLATAVFSLKT